MDYRKRRYFLARLDYTQYNYRIEQLKICVPSIKFSPPYNHFRKDVTIGKYDGNVKGIPNGCWQMMISCDKEYEEALLYELRKAQRRDDFGCDWFELTKEICGQ